MGEECVSGWEEDGEEREHLIGDMKTRESRIGKAEREIKGGNVQYIIPEWEGGEGRNKMR